MDVTRINKETYPKRITRAGIGLGTKPSPGGVPHVSKPTGPFVHRGHLEQIASRMDANVMPNPQYPLNRYGFTIPAGPGTFQVFEVTDCRVLYFAESIAFGTGAGELSIQLGETGDAFRLAPGDLIKVSGFRRFKVFNNTNAIKSGAFIVTADPNFSWQSFPRGV